MKKIAHKLHILYLFVLARYVLVFKRHKSLRRYQDFMRKKFLRRLQHRIPYYQKRPKDFSNYPIVSKSVVNSDFASFNKSAISREEALDVALQAENDRNFSPTLGGITVGLSSGTSGKRGIFLVAPFEQRKWLGIILAKLLTKKTLRQLLFFWKEPVRIAFFLRSNSNLYASVNSMRIHFHYVDLMEGMEKNAAQLENIKPHLLIAPASVLFELVRKYHHVLKKDHLLQVISVAEVLDKNHKRYIEERLGLAVQEVYQCAEGLLGTSCAEGSLHLNEQFVFFEKEWIDKDRFYPILTDFGRNFQAVVRYRLDDVLRIDRTPCPCGSVCTRVAAIEGRQDEILWLKRKEDAGRVPIFPDTFRQLMFSTEEEVFDFRIILEQQHLKVYLSQGSEHLRKQVKHQLQTHLETLDVSIPEISFHDWYEQPVGEKMKRILTMNYE